MRTDELITMLAAGAAPVEPRATQRRYVTAIGWGAFGSTLLMALFLGVRPDLAEAAHLPMFWVKLVFPALLCAGALYAAARLSRPGMSAARTPAMLAAPVAAMWLLALWSLLGADGAQRQALIFGESWAECPVSITLLSLPAFAAALWAMMGLAPTRPALAGAAAGLLAGAMGALAYALHCPEMAAPFLAIWYLLGMLIPAAIGALLGPWLLRW
jgi:hypothetical protein